MVKKGQTAIAEATTEQSVNEVTTTAIQECYKNEHKTYNIGIEEVAEKLGQIPRLGGNTETSVNLSCVKNPRRKLNVLLIGNHSAGKSSFINWYVGGEKLLRSGMNVESQGVTIVTKGKDGAPRGTFKGPATTYL